MLYHVQERSLGRRLEHHENQHFLTSNEEIFRVTFYEVLDIMISEFGRRFNQESRQYLTLLGDLQNRKIPDEANLASVAKTFNLDPIALKTEWTLLVNDHVIDATKPYKILQQLAEKKRTDVYVELTSLLTDYTRNVRACAFLNSEINLRRRVIFESCDYQGSYFANASFFVLATDGNREERLLGYLPSPRSSFSERLTEYS